MQDNKKDKFTEMPKLAFEYNVYMVFFFLCFAISIITGVWDWINIGLNWGVILRFSYVALGTLFLLFPVSVKKVVIKPLLFVTNFTYLPVLYFPATGSQGAFLLFAIIGLLMVVIATKGYKRTIFILLNIALYLGIAILEYFFPSWVQRFDSELSKLLDLLMAIVLSFATFAFLAAFVSNEFIKEQKRINSLVDELAVKNEELSDLSVKDALTGVYNRRYLYDYIADELVICKRNRSHFYVLMMDLDYFKDVNDKYGHAVGDDVLIEFARIVKDNIRTKDVLARYGGEEFVAVLKVTEKEAASEIAERVRKAVEDFVFKENFNITVSIGIAKSSFSDDCDTLINQADLLMYSAKNNGRNNVVI